MLYTSGERDTSSDLQELGMQRVAGDTIIGMSRLMLIRLIRGGLHLNVCECSD